MAEFLPLCDVLFNVISLAGYFCDVVFDVVMGYALLERGYKGTFAATMSIVITSLVISQVLSLRWYLHLSAEGEGTRGRGGLRLAHCLPVLCHCLQLGVLWRYAKLFVPVDLRYVKHEVRNLCMLRLVHAFCEAAPMLLLQLHVLLARPPHAAAGADPELREREPPHDEPVANKAFKELNIISASLSLFSVCWALASFSKNVRLQNVHRLVLTWLGVIFQFLWRLGTISARVCALTVYALLYEHWVFLVIGLHWVSMFLWLISPKNVFHGERISRPRKAYLSALIAFVYVFAYVNLQQLRHRQKMVTFYCVMLVENCLLVGAWAVGARSQPHVAHSPLSVAVFMLSAFAGGVACMLLYYRYFHVRRLGYDLNANQHGTNSTIASKNGTDRPSIQADNMAIPGVFNCRFSNPVGSNGANCRKKKKPTSFVPPPAAPAHAFWRRPLPATHHHHGGSSENEGSSVGSRVNIQQKLHEKKQKQLAELRVIEEEIKQGKLATAADGEPYRSLQRQPIPRAKTHSDVAPLAWAPPSPHLPGLQRTIDTLAALAQPTYQGYAAFPPPEETAFRSPYRALYPLEEPAARSDAPPGDPYERAQPPRYREQIERRPYPGEYSGESDYAEYEKGECGSALADVRGAEGGEAAGSGFAAGRPERRRRRCRTPEILLAPRYLEGCPRPVCCQWGPPYPRKKGGEGGGSSGSESEGTACDATPRPPSDMDSQISLPRSYTLPREFRYWRRGRRRPHAPASNNSSDADVDSTGDADAHSDRSGSRRGYTDSSRSSGRPRPAPRPRTHNLVRHETKL